MHAPRTTRAPRGRTLAATARVVAWTGIAMLVLAAATMLVTAPDRAAAARGASAVDSAQVTPAGFIPDWDGHTDVAVLSYRLLQRSEVVVRVLDSRGAVVATQRIGLRDAGVHEATWDGRTASGTVARPGRYQLRVDARPVRAAANEPGSSDLGGAVVVAGARSAPVTVQSPDVALTSVQLSRTSIGRARSNGRAAARFRLSSAATLSAAVVDSRGVVVQTLASGRRRSGIGAVAWDGRGRDGAPAADGDYSIVIAATNGGRPTTTQALPIEVDRVVPRMRTAATARGSLVGTATLRVPLVVAASEPGTVTVRSGRRTQRLSVRTGSNRLVVDGSRLGIVAGRAARTIQLELVLRDGAGNAHARTVRVLVPARRRATAPPPPATDPGGGTTTDPAPAGSWPWPLDGIVTSEFGLRNGRPHEGIDIAAPTGTALHPVAPGTVSFVGTYGGYGNLVIVDHGNGITTRYAHMSRYGAFAVGVHVEHTDVIGYVGCTGTCTGPHVHFEVRSADTARNPRAWLATR